MFAVYIAAAVLGAALMLAALFRPRLVREYLVEDRSFSHEDAARAYAQSFSEGPERRVIERIRLRWG